MPTDPVGLSSVFQQFLRDIAAAPPAVPIDRAADTTGVKLDALAEATRLDRAADVAVLNVQSVGLFGVLSELSSLDAYVENLSDEDRRDFLADVTQRALLFLVETAPDRLIRELWEALDDNDDDDDDDTGIAGDDDDDPLTGPGVAFAVAVYDTINERPEQALRALGVGPDTALQLLN